MPPFVQVLFRWKVLVPPLSAEALWTLSGLPRVQESVLCAGLQGKLLRISQDKFLPVLCSLEDSSIPGSVCCLVDGEWLCWKGQEKTLKTKLKPVFPSPLYRLFKICGFGWVGHCLFSPPPSPARKCLCSARNDLSDLPHLLMLSSEVCSSDALSPLWEGEYF